MAFPKDPKDVMTNLTPEEYLELMDCLDNRREGEFVTISTSMFASDCQWKFRWRGNYYTLSESFEVVYDIQKLTNNPMLPRPEPVEPEVSSKKYQAYRNELECLIEDLYG